MGFTRTVNTAMVNRGLFFKIFYRFKSIIRVKHLFYL